MRLQTRLPQHQCLARLFFWPVCLLLNVAIAHGQDSAIDISRTSQKENARVIASGEVRPRRYVRLTSDVSGRVKEIYVSPGETVEKGQALVLVEEQLRKPRSVKQYSPLRGVVADISSRVGEMVSARRGSPPLMTIADMATINVEIAVDDSEIKLVRVGQPAIISVDAFDEKEILGVVTGKRPLPIRRRATAEEKPPREFIVVITMRRIPPEIRDRLRPGMSATAWIQEARR
jgi:multidrug efflux pump subunit AcrA (membrane-fusion protein)